MTVKDLRKEFKEWLKKIYPDMYEGDFGYLADREQRLFEFMLYKLEN